MSDLATDVLVEFGEGLRELDRLQTKGPVDALSLMALRDATIRQAVEHVATVPREVRTELRAVNPGDPTARLDAPHPMRAAFKKRTNALQTSGEVDEDRSYHDGQGGLRVTKHEIQLGKTTIRGVFEAPQDEVWSTIRGDLHLSVSSDGEAIDLGTLGDYYYPNALHLTTDAGNIPVVGSEVIYKDGKLLEFKETVHPEVQVALAIVELFPVDAEHWRHTPPFVG